jgi:hypothetical protein
MVHVGKTIRPADNADVYDTILPMWNGKDSLSTNEQALVYALGVLATNLQKLKQKVDELEAGKDASVMEGGAKKKVAKKVAKKPIKKTTSKKTSSKKTTKKSKTSKK